MIGQALCLLGLVIFTVLIHGVGTLGAVELLARFWHRRYHHALMKALIIVRLICMLLLLHLAETGLWAMFYMGIDLFPDAETALYFSLTSYTTVGYGDVVLPDHWRLFGPVEAAVGILMFGWSTAFLVAALTRMFGDHLNIALGTTIEHQN